MFKEEKAATSLRLISADPLDENDGHYGGSGEEFSNNSRNVSGAQRAKAHEITNRYPETARRSSKGGLREELLMGGGQDISSISAFAMIPQTPLMSILHKSGGHRKEDGRRRWSGEGSSGAEDTRSFQESSSAPSSPPMLTLSPLAKKSAATTTTGEDYYERRASYGRIRGVDATVATSTTAATLKENTLSPNTYYLSRRAAAAAARSPLRSAAAFPLGEGEEEEEEEEDATISTRGTAVDSFQRTLGGRDDSLSRFDDRTKQQMYSSGIPTQAHTRSLASLDRVMRKGQEEESEVESYARQDDEKEKGISVRKRRADADANKSFVALENIVGDFRKHVDASFFTSSAPAHAHQSMAVSASAYSPFTGPLALKERIQREIVPQTPRSPKREPVATQPSDTASTSRQTNSNHTNNSNQQNLSNESSHTVTTSNGDHFYAEFHVPYSNNETTASYQRALEAHQLRCEETIRRLLREYDALAKERAAMVRGLRDQETNHRGMVSALEEVISHLRRSLDTAAEENQRLRYENRMLAQEKEQLARARESLMNYADASDLERVQLRGLLLKEMHEKVGGVQVVDPPPTTGVSPNNGPSYSQGHRQKYKSQFTNQGGRNNECDGGGCSEEEAEEVDRTISHATHTNRREQDVTVGGVRGGTLLMQQSRTEGAGLRSPLPTSTGGNRNEPFTSPVKTNINHMSYARVNIHIDQRTSSPHPQPPREVTSAQESPPPQEGKGLLVLPLRNDHFNLSPSPILASSSSPLRVERVVTTPSFSSSSSPISIQRSANLRRTDQTIITSNYGEGLVTSLGSSSNAPLSVAITNTAMQINDDEKMVTTGGGGRNSSMAAEDFRKTFGSFLNHHNRQQRHHQEEADRSHKYVAAAPAAFSHRDNHRLNPHAYYYYSASDFSAIVNTTTPTPPTTKISGSARVEGEKVQRGAALPTALPPGYFDGGIDMQVGEVSRTKAAESSTLVLDERGCAPLASLRVFTCDKSTSNHDQDQCGDAKEEGSEAFPREGKGGEREVRQPFLKIARNEGAGARAAEGTPAGLFVAFYPLAWAWGENPLLAASKNEGDFCVREGACDGTYIGDFGKNKTIDHLKNNSAGGTAREAARDYEAAAEDVGTIVSSKMLYKQVSSVSSLSLSPRRRVQDGKAEAEGILAVSTKIPSEREEAAVSKQIRSSLIHGRLTRIMRVVLEAHFFSASALTPQSSHPEQRSRPEHSHASDLVTHHICCSFVGLRCPGLLLRSALSHHHSGSDFFSRPHSFSSTSSSSTPSPLLLMHELLFIVAFERIQKEDTKGEEEVKKAVVDDENKDVSLVALDSARGKGGEVWKAKIRLVLQSTLRAAVPSGLGEVTHAEDQVGRSLSHEEGIVHPLTVNFLSEVTSGNLTRFFLSSEDVDAKEEEEEAVEDLTKHISPALLWYLQEARLMTSAANIKTSNNTNITNNALFRPRLSTSASDFHTVEANLIVLKEEDVSFTFTSDSLCSSSSSSSSTSTSTNNPNKLPLSITYNDFTASVHLEARLGMGLGGAGHRGGTSRSGRGTSLRVNNAEDAVLQSSTILTSHFPLCLSPTEASEFAARLSKALLSPAAQRKEKGNKRDEKSDSPSSRTAAKNDNSPMDHNKEGFAGLARLVRTFSSSSPTAEVAVAGGTGVKSSSKQHACVESLLSYLRGDLPEADVRITYVDDRGMNGTNNSPPYSRHPLGNCDDEDSCDDMAYVKDSSNSEGFHSAQPFIVLGLPQDAVHY